MNTNQDRIKSLHDIYQAMTGLELSCTLGIGYRWEVWELAGFTENDLRLVIEYLRRQIKDHKRSLACLRFSSLIQDTDMFGEHLSMARALARRSVLDTGKAQVMKCSGRALEPAQAQVRSAAQVMRGNEALKDLLRLRDSL